MSTFTRTLPDGATGTAPTFTSVSGTRGTSSVGSNIARPDVSEDMITYENYRRPIISRILKDKFGSKPTGNQRFDWMESSMLPSTDTVTISGGSTSEDNITVGDPALYQVGTRFVVDSTGDLCIVDSIASSQIDITKIGSGNITAASGATIHFVGTVFEQGSSSATATSVNKQLVYNYCEIHKEAIGETESQRATIEWSENDYNRNKFSKFNTFIDGLEMSLLFGVRATDTSGTFAKYYSGGVRDTSAGYISTYYKYDGVAPLEDYFFKTLVPGIFSKGSDEKTMYVGSALQVAINNYSKDKLNTSVREKEYNSSINTILTSFGLLHIQWHPMLDGTVFSKTGIVLDHKAGRFMMRYLSGNGISRDIRFVEYPHLEEQEIHKGEWKAEVGWQIEGNEYHSIIEPA